MYLGHIFLNGGRQTIFLYYPLPKSGPTSPSKHLSTSTRNRMGNLTNQRGLAMLSQKDRGVKTEITTELYRKKYFWKNSITSSTGSSITWVRFSWYGITSKPVRLLPLMLFVLCLLASYSSISPLQKTVEKCTMRVVGRSGLVLAGIMPQTCLALSCAWPACGWAAWKSTTRRRKEPWSRDLHCDWSNEMSSGTQSLRLSGQVRSVVAGQGV